MFMYYDYVLLCNIMLVDISSPSLKVVIRKFKGALHVIAGAFIVDKIDDKVVIIRVLDYHVILVHIIKRNDFYDLVDLFYYTVLQAINTIVKATLTELNYVVCRSYQKA